MSYFLRDCKIVLFIFTHWFYIPWWCNAMNNRLQAMTVTMLVCLQDLRYAARPLSHWLSAENWMWAALRLPLQLPPWEIPPPNSVKHLSVETKAWLVNSMTVTPNLKRLWSPMHLTGSPINTTHPCTMPHAMPWRASSGKSFELMGTEIQGLASMGDL